jgi:hypothetical protein
MSPLGREWFQRIKDLHAEVTKPTFDELNTRKP